MGGAGAVKLGLGICDFGREGLKGLFEGGGGVVILLWWILSVKIRARGRGRR